MAFEKFWVRMSVRLVLKAADKLTTPYGAVDLNGL